MFGIFRTDPEAERHRGLTFILVPLDADGITVRPIAQLDGETGFAEVFLEEARVPVANTLGEEGRGWAVAMGTAGFERGVSLRSPARFLTTARRLVELYRTAPAPDERDDVTQAWMDAEAYSLHTYWTVSRLLEGGTIGAEASLNKIFWSEMDLRMHETRAAAARRAARRRLARRVPVLAVGSDLRGHQRDPAQRDRRARPRAAAELSRALPVHRRPDAVPRRRTRPAREGVSRRARARHVGVRHRPRPELWDKLAGMGVVGLTVPETHGGLGLDEVDLVLILEETGRAALPEPLVETTAVGRAAVARRRRARSAARATAS